jgi:hypothetical protein
VKVVTTMIQQTSPYALQFTEIKESFSCKQTRMVRISTISFESISYMLKHDTEKKEEPVAVDFPVPANVTLQVLLLGLQVMLL